MTRKNLSLALLAALGVFFGMSELALAGSADDLFGDDLIQTQQQRAYDDSEFARIMGQEFTDFHDGAKHRQPVLRRLVLPTGPYRFIEAPFDVFWDTVSFRSRESQSEGAALVTLMFKDAVRFVPNARATRFSMNRFIDTALSRCRGGSVVRPSKGVDDGFTGFDGPTGSQLEGYQDQSLPGKTGKDYKDSGSSLDFGIDLGIGQERYPWDERVGPGNGGYPGAYGKPGGLERPIILDQQDLIVLGDRYTVGGYQGLYDFSRRNSNLVKNFLTRAASECGYERLYTHAFRTQDSRQTYQRIRSLLTSRRLPVLALLPRQRGAVLIYRIVERYDGTAAMMYWRPSDQPNRRVDLELQRENLIWAVPQGDRSYRFYDRMDLRNRIFTFGAPSTVVIVPNPCQVYNYFADFLTADIQDPGYNPGKDEPYPPYNQNYPPYDQSYPQYDQGYPPSGYQDYSYQDNSGFNFSLDFLFNGGTGSWTNPPSYQPPIWNPPPPITIQPPYWQPTPPPVQDGPYPPPGWMPPPPGQFYLKPPPKNPYCNKPVGTGRGKFVYIGFYYDQTGYNQWGFDRKGYDRRGFSLFNRAQQFIGLVNQYHTNPFAFRVQFDIKEDGSIVRFLDGVVIWNNGNGTTGQPGVPVVPVAPTPTVPGTVVDTGPEYRATTIKGKITGIDPPYEIQLDKAGHYHIFKDNVRTAIPRNINVNNDFQLQKQGSSTDYLFIQSTPAPQ